MNLYKGYVPTRGKRSLMPFKNKNSDELLTYEQASGLPEFAGVLADDVVLIDIDNKRDAYKLFELVKGQSLKCKVYETSRGLHFVFRDTNGLMDGCKTHCHLAIGLEADIKIGSKSSYEVLKQDGVMRRVKYDSGEYQNVPKYLTPIITKMSFSDVDGRNSSLYGYILPLQKAGFSEDEARFCIELINEYILDDPLPLNELDTITRDEAFQKPMFFNDKGNFLFDKFAKFLKSNGNIVKINGQLHSYRDGIYQSGNQSIQSEMIKYIPTLNKSKRTEVMDYLELLDFDSISNVDSNYIAFKNGIYDIKNDKMLEFSPDYIVLNKINFDYKPNAYSALADKTLNKLACHDKAIRQLLEEVIGYCFYTRNEIGKAFILIGDKSNGKSTFLDMVKTMIGDDNMASLDMNELDARFKTAELFGKLVNIGDDIGDEFIPNPAVFKKLATGNPLNVERKYGDPFDFSNYSKLLFSANNMPRIKDKTGAVQRRLCIIPFDAVFSTNDPDYDPYIKYKLREPECIEYLIRIGIEGLRRVLANQEFTSSERVDKELQEYEETNNPIIGFFRDTDPDKIVNEPTRAVYRMYQEYCMGNSLQPLGQIEFSKQTKKQFGYDIVVKRVDGAAIRVFVKKDEKK